MSANTTKRNSSNGSLSKKQLVDECKSLKKRYPRVVLGSLRNLGKDPKKDPRWSNKRTVEIACALKSCNNKRRIATSDLHQVFYCEGCTEKLRKVKRSKKSK